MKALVQMLTNSRGTYFVAATEADDDGICWLFSWGDVVRLAATPYRQTQGCDEFFVHLTAHPLKGWRCDGTPVVVPVPCLMAREDPVVWAQRATKAMEKHMMLSLAPMSLFERIVG